MRSLTIAGSFGDSVSIFLCTADSYGCADTLVSIGSVEVHECFAVVLYPTPSSGASFQKETMLHKASPFTLSILYNSVIPSIYLKQVKSQSL